MTRFPESLRIFPLFNKSDVESLDAENKAKVQGSFGTKNFKYVFEYDVEMKIIDDGKELSFDSIPGSGNADVCLNFLLEPRSSDSTKVIMACDARLTPKIPKKLPTEMANIIASRTLKAVLRKAIDNIDAELIHSEGAQSSGE